MRIEVALQSDHLADDDRMQLEALLARILREALIDMVEEVTRRESTSARDHLSDDVNGPVANVR